MAARSSAATSSSDRELVITRVFDAPRDLVFAAWTDPSSAARWWGPQGYTTISCEIDARPGGAWTRRLRSPEGREVFMRGIYREVVAPERLVFTLAIESDPETLVTITFADVGGKTELTLREAVFETVAARDSHVAGWAGALERLAAFLARAQS
jgi:uncharacterized protein YndB with AHSA1/START domain